MQRTRGRVSIIGLLQAAAILTIILTIATGLDIPYRNIELFSHFRLQYFVVSVLLLTAFALLRHYLYIAALAAAAIFNATFVLPWYFAESATVEGETLKLIHANVHSTNTEYERLIDLVATEKPDVIFLQEVTADWVTGTMSLLEDYPYTYAEPRPGNFGIAAFSKIPFDSIQHVDCPTFDHPTIFATVTINKEKLSIVSTHPSPPLGEQFYDARNRHLESIVDLLKEIDGELVLLGDFNLGIWGARYRQLERESGLKNVRRGFGILPSWPTFMPFAMIPIDQALVSKDISVADVRTGSNIGSDHLPLIVTLSL